MEHSSRTYVKAVDAVATYTSLGLTYDTPPELLFGISNHMKIGMMTDAEFEAIYLFRKQWIQEQS